MEPLHTSNEEKSGDDTAESDSDAKNSKRKRVLTSKSLHFVPANEPRKTGEKESNPLLFRQSEFERKANETFESQIRQPLEIETLKQSPIDANRLHAYLPENILPDLVEAKRPARAIETLTKKSPESVTPPKTEMLPRQLTEKQVQTLNRTELLALSESIYVEGSTLKQIYETHLIGERGLRRLVAEHLRGGDIKKLIRTEIVDHEIDFERDPALRSAVPVPSSSGSSTTDDPKSTLDKMVEKAASNLGGSGNEAAVYKAREEREAELIEQTNRSRSWIDGLLAALIVVVLIAVILLLYSRK